MTQQSPDTAVLLEAVQRAVEETLERKRRLGHYVVFWENGEVLVKGEDAPIMHGYQRIAPSRDLRIEEDRD